MSAKAILIIEDHTMISEYIASVLAGSGFVSIQAGSLAEAREALQNRRFDLWLCDRHLPDGDSSALLAERGTSDRHRNTPAIALTAELDANTRVALLAAGFEDALAKPCTPEALRTAIDRTLAARSATKPVKPNDVTTASEESRKTRSTTILDDAAALPVCGGNPDTLTAMRRLFAAELPAIRERIDALRSSSNSKALRDELHRLAASTAWCGAREVGESAHELRATLDAGRDAACAFDALTQALARLAQALDDANVTAN